MRKLIALLPVVVVAVACNKSSSDATPASTGSTASSATAAPTSLLQKALSLVSSGPFEGDITMKMDHDGTPHTIVYTVKGPKMRFSVPSPHGGGEGYAIFDSTTKKMTTVMDADKTAMVMDLNAMNPSNPVAAAAQKGAVDKTGKTDTVAGYSCDVWKVTESNGDKVDLCVAQGIEFPRMGRDSAAWMGELEGGFPLRAVTTDATGKEKGRMEVTKIDRKSVDDSQFTVPAGYKTMDMSAMLGGLRGLRHP